MLKKLTPGQVQAYRDHGFAAPLQAFTPEEALAQRRRLEELEQVHGGELPRDLLRKMHLYLPWVDDMVRAPAILDAVEDLIGPDILVYTVTCWIKEPMTSAYISWHQDSTTFGLSPHEHVTAWVALTDSSEQSGAVQVIPGSHNRGQVAHYARLGGGNMLPTGASVSVGAEEHVERLTLAAGEFSLHHTFLLHSSAPNSSHDRRIGLGISYIPTRVMCNSKVRLTAGLVRGVDRYEHFLPEQRPHGKSPKDAAAYHQEVVERWNKAREEITRKAVAVLP